jgi:tRNA 2-thiouridine synthesizing protein A
MDPPRPDEVWDAGDMGCGELVVTLMLRLRSMRPGQVLKLTATDLGAPHDIPAWCRMTGNPLVRAQHPHYFIRRKES